MDIVWKLLNKIFKEIIKKDEILIGLTYRKNSNYVSIWKITYFIPQNNFVDVGPESECIGDNKYKLRLSRWRLRYVKPEKRKAIDRMRKNMEAPSSRRTRR